MQRRERKCCKRAPISRFDLSWAQAHWVGWSHWVVPLKLCKPTIAIGHSLRMCTWHVDSTSLGRSTQCHLGQADPEAEVSKRLMLQPGTNLRVVLRVHPPDECFTVLKVGMNQVPNFARAPSIWGWFCRVPNTDTEYLTKCKYFWQSVNIFNCINFMNNEYQIMIKLTRCFVEPIWLHMLCILVTTNLQRMNLNTSFY